MAADLANRSVDIIVPLGTPAIVAAKKATSTIPIVFPLASDPVGEGLVTSLAHPGGNITGLSNQQPDLAGKRLEILRDLLPGFRQLAILSNANNPTATLSVEEILPAASKLGLEVGAKPADLPVEEPTKIELVVNLKTAKALGLAISQAFLMRADVVIE